MENQRHYLNKYASIIYRLSQVYFDLELEPCGIGCGQQFFLIRIHEHPGISQLELAQKGYYDRGTTTRAVKKLESLGLITIENDPADKRTHKLYCTASAEPILQEVYRSLDQWYDILTIGLTDEEKDLAQILMDRMAENAYSHMQNLRKVGK